MREGVVDSPLITAIWVSKSQGYDSCPTNSRGTCRSAINIIGIISGLEFIHSQGFVHRDLKPANLLINTDDRCSIGHLGSGDYLKVRLGFRIARAQWHMRRQNCIPRNTQQRLMSSIRSDSVLSLRAVYLIPKL
jgi:serine/threonine protein kinase